MAREDRSKHMSEKNVDNPKVPGGASCYERIRTQLEGTYPGVGKVLLEKIERAGLR